MDYHDVNGNFAIEVIENCVRFSGNIQLENYDDMMYFLQKMNKENHARMMTFDLRKLEYLNSSGIRMLITILQETDKRIHFEIDNEITWQRICLLTLEEVSH